MLRRNSQNMCLPQHGRMRQETRIRGRDYHHVVRQNQFPPPIGGSMSRRAAVVEEFDDDTDLPLPSRPLPNTGTRGPLLEEIGSDDDEDDPITSTAGPAFPQYQPRSPEPPSGIKLTDKLTPNQKTYVLLAVYAYRRRVTIYFDQLGMHLPHLY